MNIDSVRIDGKGMSIHIDAKRLNANLLKAADVLGEQILIDCTPIVPMREGVLRNSGHVEPAATEGEIVWDGPYAHYLHEGVAYVSESTGSAWARLGENKVPAEPQKNLTYSQPGTGDHWFDKAKQQHGKDWIELARRAAGHGR